MASAVPAGNGGDSQPCPENTSCQSPGGCVCDYGACLEGDDPCLEYGCDPEIGCWDAYDPEAACCGCLTDEDCAGLDDAPCTINTCWEGCVCYVLDLDCDDGGPCTTDSCDSDTPEGDDPCVHEDVPDC